MLKFANLESFEQIRICEAIGSRIAQIVRDGLEDIREEETVIISEPSGFTIYKYGGLFQNIFKPKSTTIARIYCDVRPTPSINPRVLMEINPDYINSDNIDTLEITKKVCDIYALNNLPITIQRIN